MFFSCSQRKGKLVYILQEFSRILKLIEKRNRRYGFLPDGELLELLTWVTSNIPRGKVDKNQSLTPEDSEIMFGYENKIREQILPFCERAKALDLANFNARTIV